MHYHVIIARHSAWGAIDAESNILARGNGNRAWTGHCP